MKIRLKHCKVITPKSPAPAGAVILEVPLVGRLTEYEKYAHMHRERLINWPQTFAQRGVSIQDYRFHTILDELFIFERKTSAEAHLPEKLKFRQLPESVTIDDERAGRQGDLLTYVKYGLALKVWVMASCRISFYDTFLDDFSPVTDPVIADKLRLKELYGLIFGDREEKRLFRSVVTEEWKVRDSVLHLDYHTAQNN